MQTAQINVNLNTQTANKNIEEINSSLKETNVETKTLKTQLREMTNELQGLEPGSKRFDELSVAAGKLRDQIKDTNSVIKATAGSVVENLGSGLASIGSVGIGAFQGLASAQALFGSESQALEKTLVKLQALAGLSDAIKSLGGLGDTLTNIKASYGAVASAISVFAKGQAIAAVATGAQTTATGAATVASNTLNASLLLNPILLIVAGFVAAVAALSYFSEETETAEQANEKLNASIEQSTNILDRKNERLIRAADNAVRLAEAEGKSEEVILQLKLDALRKEEDARIRNMQQYEFNIQDKQFLYKQALREENNELAKSTAKEINDEKNKLFALRSLQGQYQIDRKVMLSEASAKEKQEEEQREIEAENKRKARAEAARKERLSNSQRLIQESKKLSDDEELRLAESESKRLNILAERQKTELQLLFDKSQKTKTDEENLAGAILDINEKLALDQKIIIDKQTAEEQKSIDEANKYTIQEEKDFNKKIEDLKEENYQSTLSDNEKEIQAINDKYFTLETQAQGNADALLAIEEAKNKEISAANEKATAADTEEQKKKIGKILEIYSYFAGVVAQGFDITSQIQEELNARTSEKLQNQFSSDTEFFNQQLANREIDQEEYDQKVGALEAKKASDELALKRKAFKQAKALQIANAVIQGAQATLAAFASGVAVPLIGPATGAIYAGIAGAFSLAQIGVIASQQFRAAKGGIVPRNGRSSKEDSVNALLAPNEAVINSTSTQAFLPLLSAINQSGGGIPLMSEVSGISSSPIVKIYGNDNNQPIQAYITEQQVTSTQRRVSGIKQRSKLFK